MTSSALSTTVAPAGELGRRHRLVVLAICCISLLVVIMDVSIVNVALPVIRHDLRATTSGLQWTVDAYTLVLADFLVLGGSTADRVGRRRVFQIGLAFFGVGSLLCGLAPGIGWLVAARGTRRVVAGARTRRLHRRARAARHRTLRVAHRHARRGVLRDAGLANGADYRTAGKRGFSVRG